MRFLRKGPRLPYETRARWPERCRLGGSCRKSPTSGNPTISKRFPRRIRHQCGISLLPEQEQTRDAVVEANTWTTIQTDFLDQLIRENCLGVQDNLETVVEFVLRSPRWELSLVAPWLRLQPAKVAPFFAGANAVVRELQPCILLTTPRLLRSMLLGWADRVSAGGRLQPEALLSGSLDSREAPRPLSDAGENPRPTSLHSQGRRESLFRVGEPEPSLIQISRSRHDQNSAGCRSLRRNRR